MTYSKTAAAFRNILFLFLAATLATQAGNAMSFASSRLTVDWSTLAFNAPPGSSLWFEQESGSGAYTIYYASPQADPAIDPDPLPTDQTLDNSTDWSNTSHEAEIPGTDVHAEASTTAAQLASRAGVILNGFGQAATAASKTTRGGKLLVGADGTVEIAVDYTLAVTLMTTNQGDWAFGLSSIDLFLVGLLPATGIDVASPQLMTSVSNGQAYVGNESGRMMVSAEFLKGETVGMKVVGIAAVMAETAIPEPLPIGLIGTGLIVIRLLQRRKTCGAVSQAARASQARN